MWILCAAWESITAKTKRWGPRLLSRLLTLLVWVPCYINMCLSSPSKKKQLLEEFWRNYWCKNPYSKKNGLFSLQIQDNASWNTLRESMMNTSILAGTTHNINNSLHNWRHLSKIWDNAVQPGEGQPVCDGNSLFLRRPISQHLQALPYSTGARVRESFLTGLHYRPRRRREKREKTDKLHLSVRLRWKQTHAVLRQVTSWKHQLNPWF